MSQIFEERTHDDNLPQNMGGRCTTQPTSHSTRRLGHIARLQAFHMPYNTPIQELIGMYIWFMTCRICIKTCGTDAAGI